MGQLLAAHEQYDVSKYEEWYERLGRWREALVAYEGKTGLDPTAPGVHMDSLHCDWTHWHCYRYRK